MSTDRQLANTISRWLEAEAPMQLPDRVLRATFDQTRMTRQQRRWRAPLGGIQMNRLVPIGIATAAVVGAVFIGAQLFGSPADGGPGAAPIQTQQPTAAPSVVAPSATPAGLLLEGPHVVWNEGMTVTVTISAPDWYGVPAAGFVVKNGAENASDGAGMIVFAGEGDLYVYGDPCRWSTTRPDSPVTTVDEVVAALAAQPSRDASAPVDVTVDGYAGKSITLHVPDDAVFAACDRVEFRTLVQGFDGARYHQNPGQIDRLWILDVDGELVVIDAAYYEATPQAAIDELEAIVNSLEFD